jgi:hypothetical protein
MIAARRPYHVAFPIILIVGGLLLVLANLGTLPEDAGWRLLQLWPLILVLAGIELLMPHVVRGAAVPAITLLLVGAIAVGAFAFAIAGPGATTGPYTRFQSTSPAAGRTEGTVTIETAGAQVTITSADLGAQLYSVKIDYKGAAPRFSYADGDIRIASPTNNGVFTWSSRQAIVNLTLSRSAAWSVVLSGAGTSATIDLADTKLRSLTLNGVGGNVTLNAGSPDGSVAVKLSGVGTGLDMKVPAGTDYRVTADGLGTSVGGTAQTPGWTSASDRYDVSVDGIGAHATVSFSG